MRAGCALGGQWEIESWRGWLWSLSGQSDALLPQFVLHCSQMLIYPTRADFSFRGVRFGLATNMFIAEGSPFFCSSSLFLLPGSKWSRQNPFLYKTMVQRIKMLSMFRPPGLHFPRFIYLFATAGRGLLLPQVVRCSGKLAAAIWVFACTEKRKPNWGKQTYEGWWLMQWTTDLYMWLHHLQSCTFLSLPCANWNLLVWTVIKLFLTILFHWRAETYIAHNHDVRR